jgi:hypothetical protein
MGRLLFDFSNLYFLDSEGKIQIVSPGVRSEGGASDKKNHTLSSMTELRRRLTVRKCDGCRDIRMAG